VKFRSPTRARSNATTKQQRGKLSKAIKVTSDALWKSPVTSFRAETRVSPNFAVALRSPARAVVSGLVASLAKRRAVESVFPALLTQCPPNVLRSVSGVKSATGIHTTRHRVDASASRDGSILRK